MRIAIIFSLHAFMFTLLVSACNSSNHNGASSGLESNSSQSIVAQVEVNPSNETLAKDTVSVLEEKSINYPGQKIRGSYQNGIKTGYWMHFENDSNLVMVVSYENGRAVWTGFPLADSNYPKPVKGFSIESDSVLIECPYANGNTWYRGLYIKKKPIGLHKMYYPNGVIKFEYDYSTGRIREFDSKGRGK